MEIKTQLTRSQFIRLSLLQHFQRTQFYFYALTCALVTAFALFQGPIMLLAVAWLPFLMYVGLGVWGAYRDGSNPNNPIFLPTSYKFSDQGILISTPKSSSQLKWNQFSGWKTMAESYVLMLNSGPILAIPKVSVPPVQAPKLIAILNKHITGAKTSA